MGCGQFRPRQLWGPGAFQSISISSVTFSGNVERTLPFDFGRAVPIQTAAPPCKVGPVSHGRTNVPPIIVKLSAREIRKRCRLIRRPAEMGGSGTRRHHGKISGGERIGLGGVIPKLDRRRNSQRNGIVMETQVNVSCQSILYVILKIGFLVTNSEISGNHSRENRMAMVSRTHFKVHSFSCGSGRNPSDLAHIAGAPPDTFS
jgi:hypothetical protein